jgi:hypothetical protein
MPVRSAQLVLASPSSAGATDLYTCPAGFRTIVKSSRLVSVATVPGVAYLEVLNAGNTAGCPWRYVPAATSGQLYTDDGMFLVLNEGDLIVGSVGSVTGGGWAVWVGGAELEL